MTKVKLNKRLETIAFQIPENSQVLDVGCDHALLDIFLVQRNCGIRAVASDIKEGPLERARENIRKYGLEKEIETRLGPGIQTIDQKIDTVVVSGIGGLNIVGIFKYYPHLLKNIETLILSPNNYVKEVREQITRLGFYLKNEELIEDGGFIYPILVFAKGKKHYKKREFIYGPILLEKRSTLFQKYLEEQLKFKQHLLRVLPRKYFVKIWNLKTEIREIDKILKLFK